MTTVGVQSFTEKAQAYAKGRPNYPKGAIDLLVERLNLRPEMTVADIGAGTGQLTQDLVPRFNKVVPIEPNDDMRVALGDSAINGTAENTNLANRSVNAVFAAQAFHWFRQPETKIEFARILKEPKAVGLIWNDRQTTILISSLDSIHKA